MKASKLPRGEKQVSSVLTSDDRRNRQDKEQAREDIPQGVDDGRSPSQHEALTFSRMLKRDDIKSAN